MIRAFLSLHGAVAVLALYGACLVGFLAFGGVPERFAAWAGLLRNSALFFCFLAIAVFGWSERWAPWRFLWRAVPKLNEWIFPDVNGVWLGTVRSNWPVIEALRNSAAGAGGIDLESLPAAPLKDVEIAIRIKASWFSIRLWAKTASVNGRARSIFVKPGRTVRDRPFELAYLYEQETPEPLGSDESVHLGAATLEVLVGDGFTLDGQYWTRRKWREGMNTAGLLTLRRVSDSHGRRSDDILEFARKAAAKGA